MGRLNVLDHFRIETRLLVQEYHSKGLELLQTVLTLQITSAILESFHHKPINQLYNFKYFTKKEGFYGYRILKLPILSNK